MNSSLRYALELGCALALVAGCSDNDGSAALERGKAEFDRGEFEEATASFAAALEKSPENVEALVYAARSALELGDLKAAEASVAKAEALEPNALDIRILSAQLAYHLRDYAKAEKAFGAIAADASLAAEDRAGAYCSLGITLSAKDEAGSRGEHFDLARIQYLKAMRLNRRDAAARYHLGLLYRDAFNFPEAALEQFNAFVQLAGHEGRRSKQVREVWIPELKRVAESAKAELSGSKSRNSAAAADAIGAAEAAAKKGQWKTAKARYLEALAADGLSEPAALGAAKAIEKTDASREGQGMALDYYVKACKLNPGKVSLYVSTGEFAAKLGRHQTAEKLFSAAVAANPLNTTAVDGLIRALRKNNRTSDAAAYQRYREFLDATRKK